MNRILPGVFHWTRNHPRIKVEVSSYWLRDERVVLDPLVPPEGLEAFSPSPEHVLLTNRHHYRDSAAFAQRFGCTVWCVEQGLHEFKPDQPVRPFRFGDPLPGGITAFEIGALCPDETALVVPREGGIVALADGAVRFEPGAPLGFVPDSLIGDDPEGVKVALREAYRRLLREHRFDHVLLAHGDPFVGDGRAALEAFARA